MGPETPGKAVFPPFLAHFLSECVCKVRKPMKAGVKKEES
jgi:hypothetical protein